MVRKVRAVLRRVRGMFGVRRADAELELEIRDHIQTLTDEHLRRGLTPDEARSAARRDFGGVEQMKETYREQRAVPLLDALVRDVQYALRSFRKSPGFVCAVVLSLAAGIGVNAVVFTVFNAVLLTSLPVRNGQELAAIGLQGASTEVDPSAARFSYPAFDMFRRAVSPSRELAAVSRVARMYRRDEGQREPQLTRVQLVSGEFFPTLGVSAVRGRMLSADDDRPGDARPVAVVSHGMWSNTFGADPAIVGRTVVINGVTLTVIGVAPPAFTGVWLEAPVDLWMPLALQHDVRYRQNYSASNADALKPWLQQDGIRWLNIVGRVGAADRAKATAALTGALHQMIAERGEQFGDPTQRARLLQQRVALRPFARGFSNLRTSFALPLYVLLGMTSLILLVACANAANLLLARAAARRREIAVRLSLGAGRGRLIQQLLTESALLAVCACAFALLPAQWLPGVLVRAALGSASPFAVPVDSRVLLFGVGAALVTVVLAGLVPAWRSTRVGLDAALRATSSRVAGAHPRLQQMLVAAQVALSLMLIVGAGLFVQTLRNYAIVDVGFSQDRVVSASLNPTAAGYPAERLNALSHTLIERLEALPGVSSASTAMCGLADGCRSVSDIVIDGYQPAPGESVQVQENRVSPKYFVTTGMRLIEGRTFDATDGGGSPKVAIVNRAMARKYFPGRTPIGRRFGYRESSGAREFEIVGLVEDARVNRVQQAAVPMAFYPMDDFPSVGAVDVRTSGDPRAILADIRRAISEAAPAVPIGAIGVLADRISGNLNQERLIASLTSIFGALAALLAALGLFGVMSYAVTQRTAEFGVRMALGSSRTHVMAQVLREAGIVVAAGLACGIPAMLLVSRLLTTLLFGVAPTDPATLAAGVAVLLAIGIASAALPAWWASRVDPIIALRYE